MGEISSPVTEAHSGETCLAGALKPSWRGPREAVEGRSIAIPDAKMMPDRQAGVVSRLAANGHVGDNAEGFRASEKGKGKSIERSLLERGGGWRLGASGCCANCGCAVLRKDSLERKQVVGMTRGRRVLNCSFGGLGASVLVARRLHAGHRCEVIGRSA